MPKRFTGKLCGFLFDHLERCTFGERLRWVDRAEGVFKIFWRHGNGASATPDEDCAVFMEWHRYKTRRSECAPLDAKQRFRAALNKMKLDVVKDREVQVPAEKNFQYRKFPREDLEYQFKKGDQRVPASPAVADYLSETESQPSSLNGVSSSSAYSEPTSPCSFQGTVPDAAATHLKSPAAKSPDIWPAVRHSFMTPLGSEAPYRSLTKDEQVKFSEEIDQMYNSYNSIDDAGTGSLGNLEHSDVPMATDEVPLDDAKELLDNRFAKEILLMDDKKLLSSLCNINDIFQNS